MANGTRLYHLIDAPEGKEFDSTAVSLESLAKEGWVDDSAKIGINLWDDGAWDAVREQHGKYQRGEISGMDGMNENTRCAIWCTLASEESGHGRDGKFMDSSRAGGRYFISGTAISSLNRNDERLKARLTSCLVEQRRLGIECPEITAATINDMERSRDLTVHKRADRLLQYVGNQTPNIGTVFAFSHQNISMGGDSVVGIRRHG